MKDRNPEFEKYLDNMNESNESTGYIPEVIDFSYLGNTKRTSRYNLKSSVLATNFPTHFDLREIGKVSSVKDQGLFCGSCWAFATYASLESYLLPGEDMDFSEKNLINLHGFDKDPCEGGNYLFSTAYLARWEGPVDEIDDPYGSSAVSQTGQEPVKHVQEVIFIPLRTSSSDNEAIKVALQEYGAVSTSMYYDNGFYDSGNNSYYYSGSSTSNHGVTIVGWNDSFDFSDLSPDLQQPSGNGAFIVKNSYGDSWGEDGYFYVSYYDSQFARKGMNAVFSAEDNTNYDYIYQYDTFGMTAYVGYDYPNALEAVVYTAQINESLDAISFYTPTASTSYNVSVFVDSLNNFFIPATGLQNWNYGPAGNPEYFTSGVYEDAGYHTLKLTEPVNLVAGDSFCVILDLTTPGLLWPLPIESQNTSTHSSAATANDGEGYISPGGNIWQDLNQQFENSSPCIKVFTSDIPIEYPVGNIADEDDPTYNTTGVASSSGGSYQAGDMVTINLHILDERAFYEYYTIVVERPDGTELLTTGKIGEGNLTKVLVDIPSNATSGSYHVFERDGKLTDDYFLVTSVVPEFAVETIPVLISASGYLYMRRRQEDE